MISVPKRNAPLTHDWHSGDLIIEPAFAWLKTGRNALMNTVENKQS
jgi:hypothetical protein